MKVWRLDGPAVTFVLASDGGVPWIAYWGLTLPKDEDPEHLVQAQSMDITGGVMDVIAPLDLCPLSKDGFMGHPGVILRDTDGRNICPDFELKEDAPANVLRLSCVSDAGDLAFQFAMTGDVLRITTTFRSKGEHRLEWLTAGAIPIPHSVHQMIEYSGKWCGEFQENVVDIHPGARLRRATGGRPGHETFPGILFVGQDICYAATLSQSGGHQMLVEELPDGRRQLQFAHQGDFRTGPTGICAGDLYLTCGTDKNQVGQTLQRFVRDKGEIPNHAPARRPVHYNCWEAVYFDHSLDALKDIATKAASLGAERFVLDDGWFGKRDDDTSSLGDWTVDHRKYPDGLTPLIEHVHAQNMTFGIWFEPEMVNPDSDLYRQHPDWILGPSDQAKGRNQLTLDMANKNVVDYLSSAISAILTEYDIDYVKWDHNRVLPISDPAQARSTLSMVCALQKQFPDVMFETCASGGGRISYDFLLGPFSRVWLSDSNDALERFRMQRSASTFLPNEYVGSHVGPRVCHTSGRILPMQFRAWVAASRHMGFEMDPRELTDEEAEILQNVTDWYKANRTWMHKGVIHCLPQDDPATLGEIQISETGDRFVAFHAQMAVGGQSSPRPVRLTGLDPRARYHVQLRNPEDAAPVSRGYVALRDGPVELSGQALMQTGVQTPCAFPATMWVIEGTIL